MEDGRIYERQTPVLTATLNKRDIVELILVLQTKAKEAGDLQVARWIKPEDMALAKFEQNKGDVRSMFDTQITITLASGQRIYTRDPQNISSQTSRISTIYIDSGSTFRGRNNGIHPLNHFSILIDFSRPRLLDFSISPSGQTLNNTNFVVSGFNHTWVNAVYQVISNAFIENANKRWWLHANNMYDLIVVLPGILVLFYAINRMSSYLSVHVPENFVRYALYVYILFLGLNLFRGIFQYARWAWPRIELADNKDAASSHRTFWIMGVLAGFVASAILLLAS